MAAAGDDVDPREAELGERGIRVVGNAPGRDGAGRTDGNGGYGFRVGGLATSRLAQDPPSPIRSLDFIQALGEFVACGSVVRSGSHGNRICTRVRSTVEALIVRKLVVSFRHGFNLDGDLVALGWIATSILITATAEHQQKQERSAKPCFHVSTV